MAFGFGRQWKEILEADNVIQVTGFVALDSNDTALNLYRSLLRPLLFRLDAETAHDLAIGVAALPCIDRVGSLIGGGIIDPLLRVSIGSLEFPNPVGLAAGWDKNARCLSSLATLGFGAIEVGSVSARPSHGNAKPRLFRLPEDQAIVVNYGLPNDGAERVAQRLQSRRPSVPLGINVVRTNDGVAPHLSADEIYDDYFHSVQTLHSAASYLVLNLSCPNTDGDSDFFATPGSLTPLLDRLAALELRCPIFLKVAPNPDPRSIERWISEVERSPFVEGFLFNLPTGKPSALEIKSPPNAYEHLPGAVAGRPVATLLDTCLSEMYRRMPPNRFTLIGGGGIFTAEDAYSRIRHGASLVQLYTALIYEGPGVVRRIQRGLVKLLQRDGLENVTQAIGLEWRC
ncbi:MAG: quinone-dependent dihydroorotate dehydrogenase [Planctomycetota bacterium]